MDIEHYSTQPTICNIGKGFMHFKNLQILYLYWSNILDVSIESFFSC